MNPIQRKAIIALDDEIDRLDPSRFDDREQLRELQRFFRCWDGAIRDLLEPDPERTETHRIPKL